LFDAGRHIILRGVGVALRALDLAAKTTLVTRQGIFAAHATRTAGNFAIRGRDRTSDSAGD
jgi:hypothetical protein